MQTFKIMTCNLRTDCASDGINSFMNRRAFIAERLAAYSPDVIGFQEIRPHMYAWLVENLHDYYVEAVAVSIAATKPSASRSENLNSSSATSRPSGSPRPPISPARATPATSRPARASAPSSPSSR